MSQHDGSPQREYLDRTKEETIACVERARDALRLALTGARAHGFRKAVKKLATSHSRAREALDPVAQVLHRAVPPGRVPSLWRVSVDGLPLSGHALAVRLADAILREAEPVQKADARTLDDDDLRDVQERVAALVERRPSDRDTETVLSRIEDDLAQLATRIRAEASDAGRAE